MPLPPDDAPTETPTDKLDRLTRHIDQAQEKHLGDTSPAAQKRQEPSLRDAGFDFAGSILGSVLIGLLIDHSFHTAPWGLVTMMALGFCSGMVGAWRFMQKKPEDNDAPPTE